ncbi:MAG: hypothetical protein ACTSUJ_06630 [Candidatus Njordarchaeales archaeon]
MSLLRSELESWLKQLIRHVAMEEGLESANVPSELLEALMSIILFTIHKCRVPKEKEYLSPILVKQITKLAEKLEYDPIKLMKLIKTS